MRAQHAEAFFAEHADDGGKQAVIAAEGGAADAGHDLRALGVRPEVEHRGAADGADENQVLAGVLAEQREDFAGGAHADGLVRVCADDRRVGEAAQGDDEDAAAGGLCGGGDTAGEGSAAGEDAECGQFRLHVRWRLRYGIGITIL